MKKNDEPLSRIYVNTDVHARVDLFSRRERMRVRDAYRWLIESVLDRDGKVRAHTEVNIPISMQTFKKLSQKAREYKTSERALISAMVDLADNYSELFKGRLF